jgi:hypothetical protein
VIISLSFAFPGTAEESLWLIGLETFHYRRSFDLRMTRQ